MTREEYLKQLKNNILALTEDEQSEALQYYSDYFEDANDDEKVMAELGSPEELAQTIIDKCANALAKTKSTVKEENTEQKENESKHSNILGDALYFEFESSKVKNLNLGIGAADVVIIPGNKYSVETRGISSELMNCYLSDEGTLIIKNSKGININFWTHDRRSRIVPRILITLPENAKLGKLKVSVGAGNFRSKDISINFESADIDVGAGNLIIKSANGSSANIRCGMGNLEYYGLLKGRSNLDCGMGNLKLVINDNADNYSYDAKVGLGNFKFNNEKKSGVCQVLNNERKDNHFSVNCGMGNVKISFEK